MGLASAIIGAILKWGGYVANAKQSPKALACIETSFIWIPLGLCAAIGVLMYFYNLDGKRAKMSETLEARRASMLAAEGN